MFRVSYISWLVRFPLIRRVHLYLLLSYHCHNISPLFSQSFILVPFLFLVHWCSLHYHPRFLEHTHNSLSPLPLPRLSLSLFHSLFHMFHQRTLHFCVSRSYLFSLFSSIFRSYKRPACFLASFVALNFPSRGSILPVRHLSISTISFLTSSPSPLQLPFYRSSVLLVSLVLLSVPLAFRISLAFVFIPPTRLPPSFSVPASLAILSISCLQLI